MLAYPRISVAVFTARPGGLDVLRCGLRQQEFQDFEVILVDALYDRRRALVADVFSRESFSVIHTPPRLWRFPYDSIPPACNTAIARARGELLVWFVDYSWLPPFCLAEHWRVFESSGKQQAGIGAHRYLTPPPPAFPVPSYAPLRHQVESNREATYPYVEAESRQYVEEVQAGAYDPWMYSVFDPPLETSEQIETLPEDPQYFQVDHKQRGVVGSGINGNYLHLKNDSMALDWALEANGVDEEYTSHIYCDTDFGHRLERCGAAWMLLGRSAWVSIVNLRHLLPHLLWQTGLETHKAKYEQVHYDVQCRRANPSIDLRMIRTLGLAWYS